MTKRYLSPKQRDWLLNEFQVWHAQALVSAKQVSQIIALYETADQVARRQRSRAISTLMSVAAFLVGLAVLLLIGYNWEAMPRALKLGIILSVLIITYTVAFYLRYHRNTPKLSAVIFFLGCLFYGAGIWLVAQIFHLDAHYLAGVWWWAAGVFPFAFYLDTLFLHGLLAGLLALWAGLEVLQFSQLGIWFWGRWSLLPNGAYSLLLFALPGLIGAYRKESPMIVGLYLLLLIWWFILQPFAWYDMYNPIYGVGSLGALLLVLSESHRSDNPLALPYRLFGVLLAASTLLLLSSYDLNRAIEQSSIQTGGLFDILIILLFLMVTIFVAVYGESKATDTPRTIKYQILGFLHQQYLPVSLALLMLLFSLRKTVLPASSQTTFSVLLLTILANIVVILLALWLMGMGLREDRKIPFTAGVGYFLFWTILRYIDLFGDFGGMLGAALLFFLCGVTLFGVAFYWRHRKEIRHA